MPAFLAGRLALTGAESWRLALWCRDEVCVRFWWSCQSLRPLADGTVAGVATAGPVAAAAVAAARTRTTFMVRQRAR